MISTEVRRLLESVCIRTAKRYTSLTQSSNGKRDAEPRPRLPYLPEMKGRHAYEQQEEDDSCWNRRDIFPKVVIASVWL